MQNKTWGGRETTPAGGKIRALPYGSDFITADANAGIPMMLRFNHSL